ncbi:MAG: hypothetical protein CMM94_02275 [Rickettsiales bacterium]|nr:hypothetical protein [Rickettsiales bacterium]|tara:strand:- start:652 stop:813 length:162 start_codon:yes stop_codon:yes gene_type:complete
MSWIVENASLIGLLFFFSFFVGVAVWMFRPGMKSRIEPLANIPLNEDDHDEGR